MLAWVAAMVLLLATPRLSRLEVATLAALTALRRLGRAQPDLVGGARPHDLGGAARPDLPARAAVALVLLRRAAAASFVIAVAVAVDLLALYGLVTRLFPERLGTFDSVAAYRLSTPVGYWNTLGIITAMGIVLTFGVAARGRLVTRPLAAAALVGLAPTLYFTFSRGAVVALALGLAALVVADTRRLQLYARRCRLSLAAAGRHVAGDALRRADDHGSTARGRRRGTATGLAIAVRRSRRGRGRARRCVHGRRAPLEARRAGSAAATRCVVSAARGACGGRGDRPFRRTGDDGARRRSNSFRGPPVGTSQSGVDLTSRF